MTVLKLFKYEGSQILEAHQVFCYIKNNVMLKVQIGNLLLFEF